MIAKSKVKLLVVNVAALGWDAVSRLPADLRRDPPFEPLETVFPALTCTAQASFRTEALPCFHGLLANGFYDRTLSRVFFWEQSASLIYGRRMWQDWRGKGRSAGMLFWQQSLGESLDLILSPKPIHKHHGGMIQDCYSQPPDLYDRLRTRIGRGFDLKRYWGPLASRHSSEWIVEALLDLLRHGDAPDLLLAYLPHLDYAQQRSGPESDASDLAFRQALDWIRKLRDAALDAGYEFLVFGDYAIAPVTRPPIRMNERFRKEGLFQVRRVKGMAYPDFYASRAFAVADHELALIYTRDPETTSRVRDLLRDMEGVSEALDEQAQQRLGADNSGPDLIALAEEGGWCEYAWWTDPGEAPDFASHVDIHNKPGYDPGELFWGWPPGRVSLNPSRVRGTHGRAGPNRRTAWFGTLPLDDKPAGLVDLAAAVGKWLTEHA